MKILIIGSGGREHAIAWKVAQSPAVTEIWVAPGNAGTLLEPNIQNIAIDATDTTTLCQFAKDHSIDLTIVGPEAALAAGVVDAFQTAGLACFGPSQAATQLESSKAFAKQIMIDCNVPTAAYQRFTEVKPALEYLANQTYPVVIKADGLAAGKGVIIAEAQAEAEDAVKAMLEEQQFGDASQEIIIEEFLDGVEMSFIVMADGKNVLPLATSQDHKRRDDGDQGPNTGGMGAFSPSRHTSDALETHIINTVIQPVIDKMQSLGTPFTGFLYAGLMITPSGESKVLEFNCRLGDPETQPIMMRLDSDLVDLCEAALAGKLDTHAIAWKPQAALGVVMAAGGYPASYNKGDQINGLDTIDNTNVKVFHAGTAKLNGHVTTNGGRVLCVTALGDNLDHARDAAYAACDHIHWDGAFYRKDIGSQ